MWNVDGWVMGRPATGRRQHTTVRVFRGATVVRWHHGRNNLLTASSSPKMAFIVA
jgi:hypothetical protein